MDEFRDAMLRLIRSWTGADRMLKAYVNAGLDDNMLFQVCGQIGEAICILVGDADADWETSDVHAALISPYLSEERRLEIMMGIFEKNMVKQPAPHLFSREEMRNCVKRNGGYLYETPKGGLA